MNEHLNGKSSLINEQKIISLFIFLGLLIRLIFVFAIPAWQSPDEYPHYWVMEKIADENALPDTNPNFPAYEAFQPPLYYIIGSIVVDLYQEDIVFTLDYITPPTLLLLIRLLSAIAGMLVIFFTYLIVKEIPDLKPYDRIGSVVFVAFLPTFIGVSSTVNNDTFAVLFSAICLYYILKPNWDNKIALKSGFWAGIALATKLSSVVLLPIIFLRLLLLGINVHNRIRWLLLSILTWSIGASIFLIRNLIQFGSVFISDPGYEAKFSFSISFLVWALRNLMWSFWLAFGRTYNIVLTPYLYILILVPLLFLAGFGIIKYFKNHSQVTIFLITSILISIFSSLYYTFSYPPGTTTSWGKNLYTVLPLIAILLTVGWNSAIPKLKKWIVNMVTILMFLGCFWVLLVF